MLENSPNSTRMPRMVKDLSNVKIYHKSTKTGSLAPPRNTKATAVAGWNVVEPMNINQNVSLKNHALTSLC